MGHAPVYNADILTLPEQLHLSIADVQWVLGLNPGAWGIIKRSPGILANAPLALLSRWMLEHPDEEPSLRTPLAADVYCPLETQLGEFALQDFAIMLGLDKSAGSRLVTRGEGTNGATRRAFGLLLREGLAGLPSRWSGWCESAHQEAALRGIPNLLKKGWKHAADNHRPPIAA